MAGAVMMPIGRIGCLRAGCCLGVECPEWLHAVCVAPEPDAMFRVHALPLYFSALGIALVCVYAGLLRRRAQPGALIIAWLCLYPVGQLAIEQLRPPIESRGPQMTVVLLATAAVGVASAGVRVLRRRGTVARGLGLVSAPRLLAGSS
jgi:prolipoprotein diacylglyceryltransferase